MSDGRTSFTRDDARRYWAASGLAIAALDLPAVERLREMIDAEVQRGEYLRGTFRAKRKAKRLRSGCWHIACEAWYFKGSHARQAVTFEECGFIGFAGWSDDTNIQPIIRAFMAWVDEMKAGDRLAR